MTPQDILSHKPRVLTGPQRAACFGAGHLAAPGLIPDSWMRRPRAQSNEFLEASKAHARSNEAYDLGPDHRPARAHVRCLRALVDRHPDFWRFASESVLADIAADLVGPDMKFHSAKLSHKWPGGGEVVDWHQDIPAWPHTTPCPAPPYWAKTGYGSIHTVQRIEEAN